MVKKTYYWCFSALVVSISAFKYHGASDASTGRRADGIRHEKPSYKLATTPFAVTRFKPRRILEAEARLPVVALRNQQPNHTPRICQSLASCFYSHAFVCRSLHKTSNLQIRMMCNRDLIWDACQIAES